MAFVTAIMAITSSDGGQELPAVLYQNLSNAGLVFGGGGFIAAFRIEPAKAGLQTIHKQSPFLFRDSPFIGLLYQFTAPFVNAIWYSIFIANIYKIE